MDIQLSSIQKKKKRKRNSHFKFSIVQTCASKFLAHFIAPPTILRKTKEKVTEKEKEEKSTKLKVKSRMFEFDGGIERPKTSRISRVAAIIGLVGPPPQKNIWNLTSHPLLIIGVTSYASRLSSNFIFFC